MKATPTQQDLKDCILIEAATGRKLLTFDASTVTDVRRNAEYIGHGVASGGHSLTISTPMPYAYKSFEHQVKIEQIMYLITAVRPVLQGKVGRRFSKREYLYVLELQ